VKILYVCHRYPYPPNRGGKIRPFHMIRHFTRQGHEVTVATLARSSDEMRDGEPLAKYCKRVIVEQVSAPMALWRMIWRLPQRTPSSMGYFYSPRLAARLRELLAKETFDLIFVHCSSVAQYVEDVKDTPKIIDFGDMDSQKWLAYVEAKAWPLSLGYRIEGTKLRRAEEALAKKFDWCSLTTAAEQATLDGFRVGARTFWFPNGVDHAYFSPGDEPYEPDTIGFLGRMDYYPNCDAMLHFCDEVYPRILQRRPSTKLVIVGADPSPEIRALASKPGITVTGSVPDVRPHLRRCALTVAPLRVARGTQNKILESLSAGVPCVSSRVAAGGVDAVPGEHMLIGDTARTFAEAVLRLLENPAERERFAKAGRDRMLSHHNWENSMKRLDKLVDRCMGVPAR
jgi:sugar transferase (PEP-CTERM/EpsH1 system associated)